MKTLEFSSDPSGIAGAVKHIKSGELLAYPTEAVWGLGADPYCESAVRKILHYKRRPMNKGLILIAASIDQLGALFEDLSTDQQQQLLASWPGPHTWLIPDKQNHIPQWVKGDHSTVAVRVTNHPLVIRLCNGFGGPLVSTSANPAGQKEARTALEVLHYFPELSAILHGSLGDAKTPSTITDLTTGKRIR